MSTLNRNDAIACTHAVKRAYRWLGRGLTVTRQGECGMYSVVVVREPGHNGEKVGDGVIVYSEGE